ncbi:MAG: hypothetical protein V4535_00790 [Bacteroidota bacterium]
MQNLKNIAVGFLVSFLGSIPLGYLNVIGLDIYNSSGMRSAIFYLLGVICIEFCVIYLTLIFADKLSKKEKLLKFIEGFSVVFMFILAYIFYSSANADDANRTVFSNTFQNFFFAGIVYSILNFIQIPFWLSWNLYLLNGKFIEISNNRKYVYVFGTIAGTFCGMLILILSLHYFANNVEFLSKYLMKFIIPLVFAGLGVFQGIKFYRKYYN